MTPGDNCPECDRRLTSDTCGCGWRAATSRPEGLICQGCAKPYPSRELVDHEGKRLCFECRHKDRVARAASDDDTYAGRTVREMRAEIRELLDKSAWKWEGIKI